MAESEANRRKTLWNFFDQLKGDKVVWIIVLMLILESIVCIFSSTSRLLEEGMTRIDLVRRQLLIVLIGTGGIVLLYKIRNIRFYKFISKIGFAISLLLLAMLVFKIDTGFIKASEINGARRILSVKGLQLHVFEMVKVLMVMYLAWAIDAYKNGELKGSMKDFWKKAAYIYGPSLLTIIMILPGSNSSALFIGGIMFMVILLGGGKAKELLLLLVIAIGVLASCWGLYEISEHKWFSRIGTAISRISEGPDYEKIFLTSSDRTARQAALDKIRQPVSARIAIKEGGLIGKGPGQSTQRYVVPDISEDYMFSFIVEEYGLVGGLTVVILFMSLMARGALIARNCGKDLYAKLTVAGLTLLICGQAFLHIFVNIGIGPMTGQTLPLISHGNFAFLCFCGAFGVLLSFSRIAASRIEKETKMAQPLMEMHEAEEVKAVLDDLDDFESGAPMNDINDGYGL